MEKPRKGETSISARHDWLHNGGKTFKKSYTKFNIFKEVPKNFTKFSSSAQNQICLPMLHFWHKSGFLYLKGINGIVENNELYNEYRTRATITRSWLETAFEYIRPEF